MEIDFDVTIATEALARNIPCSVILNFLSIVNLALSLRLFWTTLLLTSGFYLTCFGCNSASIVSVNHPASLLWFLLCTWEFYFLCTKAVHFYNSSGKFFCYFDGSYFCMTKSMGRYKITLVYKRKSRLLFT